MSLSPGEIAVCIGEGWALAVGLLAAAFTLNAYLTRRARRHDRKDNPCR